MSSRQSTALFVLLMLLPATLFVVAIVGLPLVDTFKLSFTDASLRRTVHWVGWKNYVSIAHDGFGVVILRTFIWTAISVSLKMIIGMYGAVLLSARVPGRTLFRVLTMPPWIVPMAIGIFMWSWMYNGEFGMISGLLQRFHVISQPLPFLAYGNTAFFATIFTDVWIGVPMVTIYFIAGLASIPKDLHEAAWTDGASRFYRFRKITLPLMVPSIITMSILSLIATFNSFDIIWILTHGGPNGSTTTMIIDTYQTAISRHRYGAGAARAVLICIFLSLFTFIYFRATRRLNSEKRA